MESTTRTYSNSRHRRNRRTSDDQSSTSRTFRSHRAKPEPSIEELRRVRASFYKTPNHRRTASLGNMASHTTLRDSVKMPTPIREVRKKDDARHRHRRDKHVEDENTGSVYVYRSAESNTRDNVVPRPGQQRRSINSQSLRRTEPDRLRESNTSRRQSSRRASYSSGQEELLSRSHRHTNSDVPVDAFNRYHSVVR